MRVIFTIVFGACILPTAAISEDRLTVYFSNDSINGFQLSDAYETHSMGVRRDWQDYYGQIELSLVSPDMHQYRNKFRAANRSFGELVTFEAGGRFDTELSNFVYARATAAGEFGIDELQDITHEILGLQPVNAINDIIRMPDDIWFGVGMKGSYILDPKYFGSAQLQHEVYFGTDTTYATVELLKSIKRKSYNVNISLGASGITYDEIVEAPPINAPLRHIIPFATVGIDFKIHNLSMFLSERFSLPTIATDQRLFAVVTAGISHEF